MDQKTVSRRAQKPSNKDTKKAADRETTVYGFNSCLSLFNSRPEDIVRFFFAKERSRQVSHIKRWCASHKLPYRELDPESLQKVAASVHHEGLVLVVKPRKSHSVYNISRNPMANDGIVMALDGIGNTHNVGAILRSCAFFGALGLLTDVEDQKLFQAPSTARMAEGAAEIVPIYSTTDLPSALRDLRKHGAFIIGTDNKEGKSLFETEIQFPCVVVMGNESEGLSARVRKRCDAIARIPGKSGIQSLNVSVAAGVVLAELNRRKHVSIKKKKRVGRVSKNTR